MAQPSTSETALCNRALGAIGHNARLTDFDTDEGEAANICRACFWDAWLEELTVYSWNRATRRVAIPALADAPAFEFTKQYAAPADCLKVQSLYDATPSDRWRVEMYYPGSDPAQAATVIVCDIGAPLRTIYTADVRDFTRIGPHFRASFIMRLAAHIVGPITRSNAMTEKALEIYERVTPPFKLADAQEAGVERHPDGDWITSRAEAGGWDYNPYRGG